MARKLGMVLVVLAMVMALSGCGPNWNETAERTLVAQTLSGWIGAVEDYSVQGMTNVLTPLFVLMIEEGGFTYQKSRTKLVEELEADAAYQAGFRADHDYEIRVDLDIATDPKGYRDSVNSVTITSINPRYATATAFFEVWERAQGVDWLRTDSGTIQFNLDRYTVGWRISSMTIRFGSEYDVRPQAASSFDGFSGFGFGTFRF